MKRLTKKACAAVVVFTWLGGCATPQAALDQANNAAALTMSLQAELQNLRAAQANVARLRLESVRRQNTLLATYEVDAAFGERVQRAVGKTAEAQLASTLRELADSKAKDEKELQAKLSELDDLMAKLLAPVPDQAAKLAATQNAMGALGEELKFEQRLQVVATFASDLKKAIDENKKKAEAATASAPAPAAQPAATTTPPGVKAK